MLSCETAQKVWVHQRRRDHVVHQNTADGGPTHQGGTNHRTHQAERHGGNWKCAHHEAMGTGRARTEANRRHRTRAELRESAHPHQFLYQRHGNLGGELSEDAAGGCQPWTPWFRSRHFRTNPARHWEPHAKADNSEPQFPAQIRTRVEANVPASLPFTPYRAGIVTQRRRTIASNPECDTERSEDRAGGARCASSKN